MTSNFEQAYSFLFDETYLMWKSDLKKIFRIGTRGENGGCNLSSCILVLIGIESFSKFFSDKKEAAGFADFMDSYFPCEYHGRMEKIYKLFRNGLAHYFYPKSEFNLKNTSHISIGIDKNNRVLSLSYVERHLNDIRKNVLRLNPHDGRPYVLVPQVIFLDTVAVMETLKKKIISDVSLQNTLEKNYIRIRKELRHSVEAPYA